VATSALKTTVVQELPSPVRRLEKKIKGGATVPKCCNCKVQDHQEEAASEEAE
jgi:hypothetical protein